MLVSEISINRLPPNTVLKYSIAVKSPRTNFVRVLYYPSMCYVGPVFRDLVAV